MLHGKKMAQRGVVFLLSQHMVNEEYLLEATKPDDRLRRPILSDTCSVNQEAKQSTGWPAGLPAGRPAGLATRRVGSRKVGSGSGSASKQTAEYAKRLCATYSKQLAVNDVDDTGNV